MSTVIYDGTCPGPDTTPDPTPGSTTGIVDVAAVGTAGGWVDVNGGVALVKDQRFASAQVGVIPWRIRQDGNLPATQDQSLTIYDPPLIGYYHIRATDSNSILLQRFYGGFNLVGSGQYIFTGTFSGTPKRIKIAATGSSPSVVSVEAWDEAGTSVYSRTETTSLGSQGNGKIAIAYGEYDGDGTPILLASRIVIADESAPPPLTASVAVASGDEDGPTLACTPSLGAAPYSCQLQRATSAEGTFADVGVAVSTSGTATYHDIDAPAYPGLSYYRWAVTDSASATFTTTIVTASRWLAPLARVDIGDSTQVGISDAVAATLTRLIGPRSVTNSNQAVGGSSAADFAPGGSRHAAYSAALADAIAGVGAANVLVSHRFGINDGGDPSVSLAATDAIIADLPDGVRIVLHDTSYTTIVGRDAYHDAYVAGLDSRCDGVRVLKGQRAAYLMFANHRDWLADGIHYQAPGNDCMATLMAYAEAAGAFGVEPAILPGEIDDVTGQAIIDGVKAAILVDTASKLQTSNLATSSALATVATDVSAVKAKADNLPASPAAVGSAMTLNLSQVGLSPRALDAVADGSLTVGDALVAAIAGAAGKQSVSSTSYVVKTPSTGTVIRTFTLDSATSPTSRQ